MKKILSLALALVMVFALCYLVLSPRPQTPLPAKRLPT